MAELDLVQLKKSCRDTDAGTAGVQITASGITMTQGPEECKKVEELEPIERSQRLRGLK